QPGSQLRDVNVLTSGIDAADRGQWACVFRHQGDVHGNFPSLWAVVFEEVPGSSLTKPRATKAGRRQSWMCNPPRGAGPTRGSAPGRRSRQSRLPGSTTKGRAMDQARFGNPSSAGGGG